MTRAVQFALIYRHLGGTAQTGASFFVGGWILYAVQYGVVIVGRVAGQTRALFVKDRAEDLESDARLGLPGAAGRSCGSPDPDPLNKGPSA